MLACILLVLTGDLDQYAKKPYIFVIFQEGGVRSRARLFADDTALYLCISNLSEAKTLQEDLCKLELWEEA